MKKYILVCTSYKPKILGSGCCKNKGAEELLTELQKQILIQGLDKQTIAKQAACMSNCPQGVSVRTFPDRKLHSHMEIKDIDLLLRDAKKSNI